MTRDETLFRLRENWPILQREFGLRSLAVYGSVARNEADAASDVDLLVEFSTPAGYFTLSRLQQHLETLLGCNVDVNTPSSLRKSIRQKVAAEAIRVA